PEELDLHGEVRITPKEAVRGTRKLIAIPQGLKKRNLWVTIPPDIREGTRLRLKGLGRADRDGHRGDLFLEVRILN
ncbi:MAG: rhomboid family intramembrane serine protease, partial [Deltaproteobacteria bacterium]|nr:rhomboid family intramembrane serine protease [Deltaproteobacteria bacterium]